jgi:hypothetical protein
MDDFRWILVNGFDAGRSRSEGVTPIGVDEQILGGLHFFAT